jgi:peptide/nickel transport system substrate-binding protein
MERDNYWTRRIGRRRVLGGAAAAGVGIAALGLTGCGDDDNSSKTPKAGASSSAVLGPTGTPVVGGATDESKVDKTGIEHLRQTAPFASINPYKGLDSGLTWGFTILDPLFYTPADTGVRENFLAAKIEQPDDGLSYTVTLKDAVFHNKAPINGRAVKAADVKAVYDLQRDSKTVSKQPWWNLVYDKAEAIDDKTVKISLKTVDAWTFSSSNAGSPIAGIIPQEMAAAPDQMDTNIIGSGRYQIVSHENGTNFKLSRFENWRIKGEPWLAGLQYKLIQDQALALTAFSAKEIDQVAPNNKLERQQLVDKHGKDINVESQVTGASWTLLARGDGAFKDPRVNQAFSLALDRNEFIQLMKFGDGVPTGPVPPKFPAHTLPDKEVADTYGKFDVAQAKALLGQAGFDMTKEYGLKYYIPGDQPAQFAQIFQSQMKKNLGLNIKLIPEEFGKWLAQSLYGSDYDAFISFPNLDYDDPSSYINFYLKDSGGRPNYAHWLNDDIDAAVKQQKTILDDKARAAAVLDVQRKAWTAGNPFIPVFAPVSNTATWAYVKGRTLNRGSYGLFSGRTYIDKS